MKTTETGQKAQHIKLNYYLNESLTNHNGILAETETRKWWYHVTTDDRSNPHSTLTTLRFHIFAGLSCCLIIVNGSLNDMLCSWITQ